MYFLLLTVAGYHHQQLLLVFINTFITRIIAYTWYLFCHQQKQGITTTNCNIELVERCDLVVMAVKPHLVADILQEISDFFTTDKMFVSIAAGVPLEVLETVRDMSD